MSSGKLDLPQAVADGCVPPMSDDAIDHLVIKTMAAIMKHVEHDGDEIIVAHPALDVLRDALKKARDE